MWCLSTKGTEFLVHLSKIETILFLFFSATKVVLYILIIIYNKIINIIKQYPPLAANGTIYAFGKVPWCQQWIPKGPIGCHWQPLVEPSPLVLEWDSNVGCHNQPPRCLTSIFLLICFWNTAGRDGTCGIVGQMCFFFIWCGSSPLISPANDR